LSSTTSSKQKNPQELTLRPSAGYDDLIVRALDPEFLIVQFRIVAQDEPGMGSAFSRICGKDPFDIRFQLGFRRLFRFDRGGDLQLHIGGSVQYHFPAGQVQKECRHQYNAQQFGHCILHSFTPLSSVRAVLFAHGQFHEL
jgi:hypothetical protein